MQREHGQAAEAPGRAPRSARAQRRRLLWPGAMHAWGPRLLLGSQLMLQASYNRAGELSGDPAWQAPFPFNPPPLGLGSGTTGAGT